MTKTHKSPDEETVDKDMQQAERTPPPPLHGYSSSLVRPALLFFPPKCAHSIYTLSNIWTGFVLASNHNFSAAYVR